MSGVPCVDASLALAIVDGAHAPAGYRPRAVPLQRVRLARLARLACGAAEPLNGPREVHRALTEAELERLEPDKSEGDDT